MRWREIANAWDRAFFEPQSPAPLALYRILFGLLVLAKLLLLAPEWLAWFGPHAWVSLSAMHKLEGGVRIDLFDVLPGSEIWIWGFFSISLLAALGVTFGFLTRISTVLVFFALVSLDERELYAMNSGDTFLRIAAFWLMFAPAGEAFSIDRLIRIWRGHDGPVHKPQGVWAQRMIQFQTALVYFMTAWWKATGSTWVDGTAIYYVQHLQEFRRFSIPLWMQTLIMVKLQSWFALVEEFALGTLVWVIELRYWVLAVGVVLHLALEYSMNVPLFQWIMLSSFVLFILPEDLQRIWNWIRQRVSPMLGPDIELAYNNADAALVRRMNLISTLDIFQKVHFEILKSGNWAIRMPNSTLSGRAGISEVLRVIPVFWPARLVLHSRSTMNATSNALLQKKSQ